METSGFRSGDFDRDGEVTFGDFVRFAGAFGTSSGQAAFLEDADFDRSGRIDFADFVRFGRLFAGGGG